MNKLKLSKLINSLCAGNSVSWLSRQTGIDAQRLRSYARGSNTPSVASLAAIAKYMGVSVDDLVIELEDTRGFAVQGGIPYHCTLPQVTKAADSLSKPELTSLIHYLVEKVAV